MKLFKRETSINHDYFRIVKSVYPKIIDSIDSIFLSFKENRDASKSFVEYFEIGHREIHLVDNSNMSCSSVNDLLSDLFVSLTKFDSKSVCYDIPDLFYNYHAVHYYHQIKEIIVSLDKKSIPSNKIVEYFIKYEINRHENNECFCGESHELLDSYKLKKLLTKILDYYYSVNNPCFNENSMNLQTEYKYLN